MLVTSLNCVLSIHELWNVLIDYGRRWTDILVTFSIEFQTFSLQSLVRKEDKSLIAFILLLYIAF